MKTEQINHHADKPIQSLKMRVVAALTAIRPFMAQSQLSALGDALRGEEKEFFMLRMISLSQQLEAMPKTYETDGQGDAAIVQLHYFSGSSDWYITERDVNAGQRQAFGYVVLDGYDDFAELGYVSIAELIQHGVELDLHFEPRALAEIKAQRAARG